MSSLNKKGLALTGFVVTYKAMKARHASREIALLALFQLEKQGQLDAARELTQPDVWDQLVLAAVRALTENAQNVIRDEATTIGEFAEYIAEVELEHPENEALPLEAPLKSIKLPTSKGMMERAEKLAKAAERILEASRFNELHALSNIADVQEHSIVLVTAVQKNIEAIDRAIEHYSEGWALNRLTKMDRALLRLTLGEMNHVADVDVSVSIDEAVVLAKQYSEDESYKFINGVLGRIAREAGVQHEALPELTTAE